MPEVTTNVFSKVAELSTRRLSNAVIKKKGAFHNTINIFATIDCFSTNFGAASRTM